MKCISCNKEVVEVCGDGFCRECHVDLTFDDCVDGTYMARQARASGVPEEVIKICYPDARE
jgi:hypothetical protein